MGSARVNPQLDPRGALESDDTPPKARGLRFCAHTSVIDCRPAPHEGRGGTWNLLGISR